ncbi:hypothetical protein DAKH74_036590 [Maudiozyma humilis]|uniref:Decapping nuclease n=1 Tax=Maudiozyma humilis TaxID=51915 RepID=A0AAV5S2D9_MAUHU|nr:hypothetical protein DAKH74_036590 [Kazachstania humilis]
MPVISRLPLSQRNGRAEVGRPRELACYSRSGSGQIKVNSDENLRYYYFPDGALDTRPNLSIGRGSFRDYRSSMEDVCSLHGLLETIQSTEQSKKAKMKVHIVTFRGIIRKMISSAFEGRGRRGFANDMDFRMVIFDGQLFIKEEKKKDLREASGRIDLNTFTGYKFEALTTLPKPLCLCTRADLESRPSQPVDNGDEFVTVVGTSIGGCRIILGAEVDGIFDFKEEAERSNNVPHYMELKCTKSVEDMRDAQTFQNKLFRTWIQCFLVGIPRIIYGFRNERYELASIEEYTTSEVPEMLGGAHSEPSTDCGDAVVWYGTIVEWLMGILTRYNQKASPEDIIPFRLTMQDGELQLSDIQASDGEYDSIVNGDAVLSNEFKAWRRQLHRDTLTQ